MAKSHLEPPYTWRISLIRMVMVIGMAGVIFIKLFFSVNLANITGLWLVAPSFNLILYEVSKMYNIS